VVGEDKQHNLNQFVKDINRDVLIGAVVKEKDLFYNAALLVNRSGEEKQRYYKIKLVPFGEYIPWRKFFQFIPVINLIGDMSAGSNYERFIYQGKVFSVLICFEDLFPLHVRKFAENSDFLVNITNDAWFDGEPQAHQHLAIMTFRAIENRISFLRSANTGISGVVSALGQFQPLTETDQMLFHQAVGEVTVKLKKERSFYNRYPNMLSFLSCCVLIGVALIGRRRR